MDKHDVAKILEEISVLLELHNENPFKVRAYKMAAHSLLNMKEDLQAAVQEGTLSELEGIGEKISAKITQLVTTGHLPYYEDLKQSTPPGLLVLMHVHGLGAKKIITLYKKRKISSIESLKEACLKGKIAKLRGFGEKTQKNILDAIAYLESYKKRHLWWDAMAIASPILEGLRSLKGIKRVEVAGSLRRKLETIGDLDFLAAASHPGPIMKWFTTQPFVDQILAKGETKSSILLKSGIQADLRIVSEKQFAFALCYFTGSKDHNIKLRQRANARGWSLNEYEMITEDPASPVPFSKKKLVEESDIYKALGLCYIPPELRENMDEYKFAEKGKLPLLVEERDIRGTFHNHTSASDGRNTLEEMVEAAQRLGWDYIGISDHSKSSFQANGLNEEQLLQQLKQIKKLNASKKFRTYIFAGTECDILPNGKLDFTDSLLKELEYVVVSVHSSLHQDEKTMTKRLIRAIEHPYTTMVGHVTGRILLQREPYAVNLPKVIDACIANGKIIELNAQPTRLDMDWRLWHEAAEKGLMCSINTDAHAAEQLEFFRAGVNAARKGWLTKDNILNTWPLKEVQKLLKKISGRA